MALANTIALLGFVFTMLFPDVVEEALDARALVDGRRRFSFDCCAIQSLLMKKDVSVLFSCETLIGVEVDSNAA